MYIFSSTLTLVVVWRSGNVVWHINEVTPYTRPG